MRGVISQFETEIRAERQMDGIQKTKERGVTFRRRKMPFPARIRGLQEKRNDGMLIKTLMREYALSKATVYRYLQTEAA